MLNGWQQYRLGCPLGWGRACCEAPQTYHLTACALYLNQFSKLILIETESLVCHSDWGLKWRHSPSGSSLALYRIWVPTGWIKQHRPNCVHLPSIKRALIRSVASNWAPYPLGQTGYYPYLVFLSTFNQVKLCLWLWLDCEIWALISAKNKAGLLCSSFQFAYFDFCDTATQTALSN